MPFPKSHPPSGSSLSPPEALTLFSSQMIWLQEGQSERKGLFAEKGGDRNPETSPTLLILPGIRKSPFYLQLARGKEPL